MNLKFDFRRGKKPEKRILIYFFSFIRDDLNQRRSQSQKITAPRGNLMPVRVSRDYWAVALSGGRRESSGGAQRGRGSVSGALGCKQSHRAL